MIGRFIFAALAGTAMLHAWTMSVEFPYTGLPRIVWERELAHLKEMGVVHVSLPLADDFVAMNDVVHAVRKLNLQADIEGKIPAELEMQLREHGGPLTASLEDAVRISALMPRALDNERKLIAGGGQSIVWTDVFDTLSPGFQAGAIGLDGREKPYAAMIRREVQLSRAWGPMLASLREVSGARPTTPTDGIVVHQYVGDKTASAPGLSFVSVTNDSIDSWSGEVRALYPALQRAIALPNVSVAAHDTLWLPVNVPLTAGPLCSTCNGFAPSDHLAYATAELTHMEYENGVLALEFIARSRGEAVIQLSHEPEGPLVAAGHPVVFDWDGKTGRARLPIPAGKSPDGRVRIALAIDAPPATAMFASTPVLLIGEKNRVSAKFSPLTVVSRSRLRTSPEFTVTPVTQKSDTDELAWDIDVPASAVAGSPAQLAIDADGVQLSHIEPRLSLPVTVAFEDAVAIRTGVDSAFAISPATIPVNQKSGRELVVGLHNNAAAIRTFQVSLEAPGLAFSPPVLTVSVGALLSREITFRVFVADASAGIHDGAIRIGGAATFQEPVRFVVIPQNEAVKWTSGGFDVIETSKIRASFLAGRWLEMIDKSTGTDSQPAGGTAWSGRVFDQLRPEDLTFHR